MQHGFSFASVILSYFLVGGGMFAGTLVAGSLDIGNEWVRYGCLAAGAFVGGFIAARASRGSTVLEPAIGTIGVVATIVGLAAGTDAGQLIWKLAQDQTTRFIATVAASCVGGAIAGAFLSEKIFGHATESSIPWLLYTALSVFGACVLAMISAAILFVDEKRPDGRFADLGMTMAVGMAAGCLLAGLAVGASARSRPLLAGLLGGGLGVAGFCLLIHSASVEQMENVARAIGILAGAGAGITLIGTALGWLTVGRRYA
jgi:hypothetical protein